MYGSSRVGVDNYELELCALDLDNYDELNDPLGDQRYELTDHLGNVTSVLTDEILGVNADGNIGYEYFQPHVVSAQGYEPFGSLLPGRNYSSGSYRFGFNGMPKDDEVHGATGTSYDFGARLFDPRVGRWYGLDPLVSEYPAIGPYVFALNAPLLFKDPNGKEGVVSIVRDDKGGGTITVSTIVYVTGDGATPEAVQVMQEASDAFFAQNQEQYTDADGNVFDLKFSIKFEYAPDQTKIDLQQGQNVLCLLYTSNTHWYTASSAPIAWW